MKGAPINPKVAASVLGGAVAYMILRVATEFGFTATPQDASMLTIILVGLAGYFKEAQ